jgi:hypothetical protein
MMAMRPLGVARSAGDGTASGSAHAMDDGRDSDIHGGKRLSSFGEASDGTAA